MMTVDLFAGQKVGLIGLAGSGLATAKALQAGGATVLVQDDNPDRLKAAEDTGLTPADLKTVDWRSLAALILAPGVPLTHPTPHWSVPLAKAAGVEIIGDIELFYRVRRATAPAVPVIAITGTNGKSTTTALIAHILGEAGYDVQMGGNIGTPVLELAAPNPAVPGQVYVLEMSSYQIDLAPSLDPSIGILLNLSPDHLDRHGTMANYAAIKERLVESATDLAIVGVDDDDSSAIADKLKARPQSPALTECVTIHSGDPTCWHRSGTRLCAPFVDAPFADLKTSDTLRGTHNAQNALTAAAACRQLGLTDDQIAAGLLSFPGLAHRMELVARLGHILFVNDSKATNAEAAARALAAYDQIFWIAGGVAKDGGITSLTEYFTKIRHSYLIGKAADDFALTLQAGPGGVTQHGSLDDAVAAAAQAAIAASNQEDGTERGDSVAVLLSPACASFDQFANFEARGKAFKEAVLKLEGIEPI